MRAMNLYLLTRAGYDNGFAGLARELTGNIHDKEYSRHEAQSLRMLVDELVPVLKERQEEGGSWISYLEGFYFSFTIAHISKEFDLLKIAGDGECVLNIELKSETIEESRIAKQLAQNRYYLSHITGKIYSFTYVMETNTLYNLNDKGFIRVCSMEELADVLVRPSFKGYVEKDLDLYFRAADYLISPAAEPDKFLMGGYFLTSQQAEFKRKIMEILKESGEGNRAPVVAIKGSAGTGKTLLIFDLAMALTLNKKKRVLILLGGKMQYGHKVIDERLTNVFVLPADRFDGTGDWSCILFDEANRACDEVLERITEHIRKADIPCIMAYDPHLLTDPDGKMAKAEEKLALLSPRTFEFTGNIRINRPVYSFLRALFNDKESSRSADYECIEVLFAGNREEAALILDYYSLKGYRKITLPGGGGEIGEGLCEDEIVGLEFERVTVILDSRFYYDEKGRLRVSGSGSEDALTLLYEGISRTRENLCLLILEDEELFSRIMAIRGRS